MGSRSHGLGLPQRPGLASSRGVRAIQEHQSERTADNRWVTYLQPSGRPGLHWVKSFCNERPYLVAGPGSFTPGAQVLASSSGGHPMEQITSPLAGNPRGASGAAQLHVLRTAPFVAVSPDDPCLVSYHLGHDYTAVYYDSGANTLSAWLYRDGDYQTTLDSADASLVLDSTGKSSIYAVAGGGHHVIFWGSTGAAYALCSWQIGSGVVNSLALSAGNTYRALAFADGFIWYVRKAGGTLSFRKCAIDCTGDVEVSSAAAVSDVAFGYLTATAMNLPEGSGVMQFPRDGSAVTTDSGRSIITRAGDIVGSYFYTSGGLKFPFVSPGSQLCFLGDTGDEQAIYPAAWMGFGDASFAPNPALTSLVAYESGLGELFRWPLATPPDGHCPAPIITVSANGGNMPQMMWPRN